MNGGEWNKVERRWEMVVSVAVVRYGAVRSDQYVVLIGALARIIKVLV